MARTVLSVSATKSGTRAPVAASNAAILVRAVPLTLANVPPAKRAVAEDATATAGMEALGSQASSAPAPVVATAPR
jgi:hypothetical protein